jgi:hypothetical protein
MPAIQHCGARSFNSWPSNDGRFAAFVNTSTNLAPPGFGSQLEGEGLYVRDRVARTTRKVLAANGRELFDLIAPDIRLSGNGEVLVFLMEGYFIEPCTDPEKGGFALALLHIPTWSRECVIVNDRGEPGNGGIGQSFDVSDDGNRIVFWTDADNLPGLAPVSTGIYLRDRRLKRTVRLDLNAQGEGGNATSQVPVISANGRWVTFTSRASNLTSDDANGANWDVFLVDAERMLINNAVPSVAVAATDPWSRFSLVLALGALGLVAVVPRYQSANTSMQAR